MNTDVIEVKFLPAIKGGRSWNGFHKDRGQIVHAVSNDEESIPAYWGGKAACGTETGSRSFGWSHVPEKEINCPKCLKKMTPIKHNSHE
jgi:hypothetical protein